MSSFIRRIQRQVLPSTPCHVRCDVLGNPIYNKRGGLTYYANPSRGRFWGGRGQKLGVFNPEGKDYLARIARENRRAKAQI